MFPRQSQDCFIVFTGISLAFSLIWRVLTLSQSCFPHLGAPWALWLVYVGNFLCLVLGFVFGVWICVHSAYVLISMFLIRFIPILFIYGWLQGCWFLSINSFLILQSITLFLQSSNAQIKAFNFLYSKAERFIFYFHYVVYNFQTYVNQCSEDRPCFDCSSNAYTINTSCVLLSLRQMQFVTLMSPLSIAGHHLWFSISYKLWI